MSLAGVFAAEFFLDCMARGGSLPTLAKADKRRAQLVLDYFIAFATPEERLLLLPPPPAREGQAPTVRDEGSRRLLCLKFHDLLVEFLRRAFIAASLEVPSGLSKGKKVKLLVGALESRLDELAKKSKAPAFRPDPDAFALFRAEYEKTKGDSKALPKRPRADSGSSAAGGAAEPTPPTQQPQAQNSPASSSPMHTNAS